ncbi:hypothetical protein B0H16DRAFT_1463554 [Mycena metata]|uniref:Uncharacterized protein n=1 Tax=Mycena metata TaxID=1033252 RepID=A0AAD7IJC7_9AGAR|nr:hypothetical protein B0H16DRAFT_1463554 [Mycena metata]
MFEQYMRQKGRNGSTTAGPESNGRTKWLFSALPKCIRNYIAVRTLVSEKPEIARKFNLVVILQPLNILEPGPESNGRSKYPTELTGVLEINCSTENGVPEISEGLSTTFRVVYRDPSGIQPLPGSTFSDGAKERAKEKPVKQVKRNVNGTYWIFIALMGKSVKFCSKGCMPPTAGSRIERVIQASKRIRALGARDARENSTWGFCNPGNIFGPGHTQC